jgi:hypothetical protein
MEPLKAFVSSVMRPSLEDFTEERKVAFEAVESLAPIACAWAFEREPASTKRLRESYIDEVKTCDLLLLIVGRVVTPAVREEFDTARDHEKPILAFVKNVPQRDSGAAEVLALLDAKYDTFTAASELRDKIRSAVCGEILRRARGDGETHGSLKGDIAATLRAFSRTQRIVRVAPVVPRCQYDLFAVTGVQSGTVTLHKQSTMEDVTVPLPRVAELLSAGDNAAPTLVVNGRLQWLTLLQRWRFFRESPDTSDTLRLGVGRETGRNDPLVVGLGPLLAPKRQRVTWSEVRHVAGRLASGTHEVFYDEEGKYLVSSGAILMVTSL